MQKWSLNFRVWHWIHATVVLGLLGTVFLRKTFLSWRDNSEILSQKLSSMDIIVNADQAKILAKSIRAPMWDWHIILGYALGALLIWRVALFFTHSGKRSYLNMKNDNIDKKLIKLGYIVVYLVLAFLALSGYIMEFYKELGLLKDTAHDIKELHELIFNVILIFAPLHILGVFMAENRDEKGILSDMVNGGEE